MNIYRGNVVGCWYLCIDIETTGLDEKKGDILEVYWKIANPLGQVIEEVHGTFWSPWWWKTMRIHKIPLKELLGKPTFMSKRNQAFRDRLKSMIELCYCDDYKSDLVFMAQYAPFEIKWFAEKLGIDPARLRVYDTRDVEKALYPDVSHSLIPTCERRGIQPPKGCIDFHRAKYDVDAMFEVARQQFKEIESEQEPYEPTEYSYVLSDHEHR